MAGLTFAAAHFIWQVRLLDADDPAGAGYLFKSNRDAGLLLSAGITGDMIVRYFIAL
jgi:4-hydroxybenzoate polyprenyltransferase